MTFADPHILKGLMMMIRSLVLDLISNDFHKFHSAMKLLLSFVQLFEYLYLFVCLLLTLLPKYVSEVAFHQGRLGYHFLELFLLPLSVPFEFLDPTVVTSHQVFRTCHPISNLAL